MSQLNALEKGVYRERIPVAAKNRLNAHLRARAADQYAERLTREEQAARDYRWIRGE